MRFILMVLFLVACGTSGEADRSDERIDTSPIVTSRPCTVDRIGHEVVISCPDGSSESIRDGQQGPVGQQGESITGQQGEQGIQGTAGVDGINGTVIEIIDPCGPSNGYDEVILKLDDTTLVVYFEYKKKRHLTVLTPGSYRTTDVQKCHFTVEDDYSVIY